MEEVSFPIEQDGQEEENKGDVGSKTTSYIFSS
jgi:hypothetical protein